MCKWKRSAGIADRNGFALTMNQQTTTWPLKQHFFPNSMDLGMCDDHPWMTSSGRRSQEELEIFKGRLSELNQQVKTLGDENSCSATDATGAKRSEHQKVNRWKAREMHECFVGIQQCSLDKSGHPQEILRIDGNWSHHFVHDVPLSPLSKPSCWNFKASTSRSS